ncbi:MAG: hypothetical protein KTM48_01880 [Wolbachia endosymbiont of Pissodes strobi]|nr:hypothetical protein [Wolbachia endosymbiont of Pissodes strobi]
MIEASNKEVKVDKYNQITDKMVIALIIFILQHDVSVDTNNIAKLYCLWR